MTTSRVYYDGATSAAYFDHHRNSIRTRLSTARERYLAKRALGDLAPIGSAIDLACGNGRFWNVMDAACSGSIYATDISWHMLKVGTDAGAKPANVNCVVGSAFCLPFTDDFVDVVLCMRFMHHLAHSEDRIEALTEFRRVAKTGVCLSNWVDGNLPSRRRMRRQTSTEFDRGFGRRVCISASQVESEFEFSGFTITGSYDFLRGLS